MIVLQRAEALESVYRFFNVVTAFAQDKAGKFAQRLVVFKQQDSHRHAADS